MMAAKKKTRSIGKRISIADHGDATTIVIDTTITDTQRMSTRNLAWWMDRVGRLVDVWSGYI